MHFILSQERNHWFYYFVEEVWGTRGAETQHLPYIVHASPLNTNTFEMQCLQVHDENHFLNQLLLSHLLIRSNQLEC